MGAPNPPGVPTDVMMGGRPRALPGATVLPRPRRLGVRLGARSASMVAYCICCTGGSPPVCVPKPKLQLLTTAEPPKLDVPVANAANEGSEPPKAPGGLCGECGAEDAPSSTAFAAL
jgi:hypothetical protein